MKKRIMMNMVVVILTISMILSMSVNAYAADIDDDVVIPEETVDLDAEPLKIIQIDEYEDGTKVYRFKRGNYTIPYVTYRTEQHVTESGYVEKFIDVPHYLQQSYEGVAYGNYGTISSHGCGITSCAMVFSYLLDREILPDKLAEEYGRFNTSVGSDYALFETSAADYGLSVQRVWDWESVEEALKNGCVVISNVRKNLFTKGGHYIVLYGINEEGRVFVNDPNIYNYGEWSATALKDGFKNGFEQKYVKYSFPCWIYSPKDMDAIVANAENVEEVE